MINVIIRDDSETSMMAKLKSVGCKFTHGDAEGADQFATARHEHALHIIGPLVLVDGVYDSEGNEVTPPVMDNKCHAMIQVPQEVADILDTIPGDPNFVLDGAAAQAVLDRHQWL